jgi:hypothetical protein
MAWITTISRDQAAWRVRYKVGTSRLPLWITPRAGGGGWSQSTGGSELSPVDRWEQDRCWGFVHRLSTGGDATVSARVGNGIAVAIHNWGKDGDSHVKSDRCGGNYRMRGCDLMRLVRSVTWLYRLRRSAISWRIFRSACITVV